MRRTAAPVGALALLGAAVAAPASAAEEVLEATAPPMFLGAEEVDEDGEKVGKEPCRMDKRGRLLDDGEGLGPRFGVTATVGRAADGPFTVSETEPQGSGHYFDVGVTFKVGTTLHGFCLTTATTGWRHVGSNRKLALALVPLIRPVQDVDGDRRDELVIAGSINVLDGSPCGEGPDCIMWATAFDRRGRAFVVDAGSTRTLRANMARAYGRAAAAKRVDAEDRKHYAGAAALLAKLASQPAQNGRSAPVMPFFESAEAAAEYVKTTAFSDPTFILDITDDHTFAGRPDSKGAGMALVVDAVLKKGFEPDGFQQMDGYRVYRYKKVDGAGAPRPPQGQRGAVP
jgi:hypothetical protein